MSVLSTAVPARHCETMSPFVGVHGDLAKSYLNYFKLVLSRSRNPYDLKELKLISYFKIDSY